VPGPLLSFSGALEGIVIALEAIRANKVRAGLTILGIAVGVFVVVVMSAAVHGINASVARDFESAGPTSFFVFRYPISFEACDGSDDTCKWRYNPRITLAEAAAIERLDGIQGVTAQTQTQAAVRYKDRQLPGATIDANTENWTEVDGGDIYPGRSFTHAEAINSAAVALVNDNMAKRLFGDSDPIGKTITIRGEPFTVIGLYHYTASFLAGGDRAKAIVPFETAQRRLDAGRDWVGLTIKPRAGVARDIAIDDVTALLRARRGLKPSQENNFAVVTQDKLFETYNKIFGMFFLVMFVLSAIGLIVGGVGVVAIMMISVTERTREIGVRKALGATRRTILWQFLVEAVTLTGIGAAIGLIVGWGVSTVIRHASPIQASVPPLAILAALIASAFTGILFGILPAARAARLDPVAALRHE
jgi:putative ABC transport system permease protein